MYKLILLVLSLISSFVAIYYKSDDDFTFLFIIPLIYGLWTYWYSPKTENIGVGLFMLYCTLFFRYIVFPVVFVLSAYETYIYKSFPGGLMYKSMQLFVYEMLAILASVTYFDKKYKNKIKISSQNKKSFIRIPKARGVIIMILISLGFIISDSSFIDKYSFFLNVEEMLNEIIEIGGGNGVADSIIIWTKILLTIFLFTFFYKRYLKRKSSFYFILSIVAFIIPSLFYASSSRMSMLLPLIASLFILRNTYHKRKKIITILILSFTSFSMLILTLYKNLSNSTISSAASFIDLDSSSNLLNMYFAGIPNIAAGISTNLKYSNNFGIDIFINDMLGSLMGLASSFPGQSSRMFFGEYIFGANSGTYDQILPTVIQGYFYFGFILAPIFSVIMVWFFTYLDSIVKTTRRLDYAFLIASISAIVGFAVPGSLSHLTISSVNVLLPVLLIMYLNGSSRIKIDDQT
tara:strand:+ start:5092 stop:6477 length:1386 start_codon:yes stop_codon:yes gene_type:complete